jgi:hypothetical protein
LKTYIISDFAYVLYHKLLSHVVEDAHTWFSNHVVNCVDIIFSTSLTYCHSNSSLYMLQMKKLISFL